MKKQGFTLIELMVVIVIMGILAAVAVPKLFGMIAKSKASEVGPAAGTYVKLQQTYFAENNQIGGWDMVGYIAPNGGSTTNFFYGEGIAHSGSASQNATDVIGWAADNKITLNECVAGTNITTAKSATASDAANWIVKVSVNTGTTADVTFVSSAKTAGCIALTPSFSNIK
ncbi:type II secretion system protein [uncultured Fibrobacter sp.]|uniref:type IV pilin protein n=1 Tax=uncultured Fibrobacter sp. TaxID=261512 RepID=UPI0025DB0FA1|nr:type II secretion system protein [uncultured Fibrobacter sp.]